MEAVIQNNEATASGIERVMHRANSAPDKGPGRGGRGGRGGKNKKGEKGERIERGE